MLNTYNVIDNIIRIKYDLIIEEGGREYVIFRCMY